MDTAPLDYGTPTCAKFATTLCTTLKCAIGSPFTIGQAQSHISKGELGSRITWVQNNPISFLESRRASDPDFDLIVFAHSLWYFSSPEQIRSTLNAAARHATRIAIAEYSLHASPSVGPNAVPHVYAAFAQAALEVHKPKSISNIRTVVGPKAITAFAANAKLKIVQQATFTPAADVDDARWETGFVKGAGFLKEVRTILAKNDRERELALALRDAMLASISDIPEGSRGVRTMDVWCAVFENAGRTKR